MPCWRGGRARSVVATVAAVTVVAAGGPAVARSQAAQPGPKAATELPALASERPVRPAPEIPAAQFAELDRRDGVAPAPSELDARNRAPRPSAFDPARSTPVESETTPTRKVFENPDGSRSAQLSSRPVRYRDGTGAWKDFDLSLVPRPDGTLRARSAPEAARLSPQAGGSVAVVDTAAGPIALGHPEASTAAVALGNDMRRATYPKALPGGRDLVLELTPDGFKENVVLADASALPTYLDQFSLPPGVTARQAGPVVEFLSATGEVLAGFRGGIAFDASFPAAGMGASAPVAVRLVPTPSLPPSAPGAPATPGLSVATVEVSVDRAWLTAPGRSFPVTIDPVFYRHAIAPSGGRDTYVTSGPEYANSSFGSSPALVAGTNDGGAHMSRSLIYFDISGLPAPNRVVTNSDLQVYNYYSPSCSPRQINLVGLAGPFSDTTTWNTQPADTGVVSSASFAWGPTGCLGNWAHFNATSLVQGWFGTSPN